MQRNRRAGSFAIAVSLLAIGILCPATPVDAKTKVASRWLDREISIDGEIDEWRDVLSYVRSVDAFVAMYNDEEALYLCLYSQSPRNASQFITDGLRIKVDGGKYGTFIVRYPKGTGADPVSADLAEVMGTTVELRVDGQRDPITVAASGETGIEAAFSHDGSFAYELKLPMTPSESNPWAPGLAAGDRFKLVIENPQLDTFADERPAPRSRSSITSPGTGPGGQIGGPNDPGWSGRIDEKDPFFQNRLVFLLKARVELAKMP